MILHENQTNDNSSHYSEELHEDLLLPKDFNSKIHNFIAWIYFIHYKLLFPYIYILFKPSVKV
jgi:hypothetical protein